MVRHLTIGGELEVSRLGFGAMRITGAGVWGHPDDPEAARQLLRRAHELGVNLIDTSDSYGPHVSEELIAEALHPYPEGLVIATGCRRTATRTICVPRARAACGGYGLTRSTSTSCTRWTGASPMRSPWEPLPSSSARARSGKSESRT